MISSKTTPHDMQLIRAISKEFLSAPEKIPVSFVVDGKRYSGLPAAFSPCRKRRYLDANILETVFTGTVPDSELFVTVTCEEYQDFPVLEWTVEITNCGKTDSPQITGLTAMNGCLPGSHPKIEYNTGDTCDETLYTDAVWDLCKAGTFTQQPDGGRGSDCALPYYRVLCDDCSYNLSIGWPGQWTTEFSPVPGGFAWMAKQQYTDFYLQPGETVRTPRMTVMVFKGDGERAINLWRHWMFAHVIPKPNGGPIETCISLSYRDEGEEFTKSTEKKQLDAIDCFVNNGIKPDNLWIDAGWYPCKRPDGKVGWPYTGTLPADRVRFPRGMKPIGDRCHENGMKLLLWFEPERIHLAMMDPEYEPGFVLKLKDLSVLDTIRLTGFSHRQIDDTGLLNLADKHCQDVMIDKLDGLIKEYGVDIFRQDFNFPPLHWWMQNDGEGRCGMTENLYVQGYLRLFEELQVRNPGLWINQVSSGGRRSDLETLRRSVSLHQSDYAHGLHPLHQAIRNYSFIWQGYCGAMTISNDDPDGGYDYQKPYIRPEDQNGADNFMLHNAFCPEFRATADAIGFTRIHSGNERPDRPERLAYYKSFAKLFYRAAPYTIDSDFYVLNATDRTNRCWSAIQFHREDTNEGIVQAIRNTKCEEDSITLFLRGINPDKMYLFESPEFGRQATVSGKVLTEKGFTVTLPRRTGEIWFYRAE